MHRYPHAKNMIFGISCSSVGWRTYTMCMIILGAERSVVSWYIWDKPLTPRLQIDELWQLDMKIRDIQVDGCTHSTCLCSNSCYAQSSVLDIWCDYTHFKNEVLHAESPKATIIQAINRLRVCNVTSNPLSFALDAGLMFGAPRIENHNDTKMITAARSAFLLYHFQAPSEWNHRFRDLALASNRESANIQVAVWSDKSINEELQRATAIEWALVCSSFVAEFCVLTLVFYRYMYRSNAWMSTSTCTGIHPQVYTDAPTE